MKSSRGIYIDMPTKPKEDKSPKIVEKKKHFNRNSILDVFIGIFIILIGTGYFTLIFYYNMEDWAEYTLQGGIVLIVILFLFRKTN